VVARWDRELSLEEQQLVALARLFLQQPRWLVMDEAMSALDQDQRDMILARVARDLPGTAVIATSRVSLNRGPFFDRMIKLHFHRASVAPVPIPAIAMPVGAGVR
jgi:putative ATP-binding cassette transporter